MQLRCNDSFTLRTDEFKAIAHDIALHIAALKPLSVSAGDLAPEHWQRELAVLNEKLTGFDTAERQRRLTQMRERFERDWCLLKQPHVKNSNLSVEALLADASAKLRDEITIVKFARYDANET